MLRFSYCFSFCVFDQANCGFSDLCIKVAHFRNTFDSQVSQTHRFIESVLFSDSDVLCSSLHMFFFLRNNTFQMLFSPLIFYGF